MGAPARWLRYHISLIPFDVSALQSVLGCSDGRGGRESKNAQTSSLITVAIQGCLITSRPDNKQELIHVLTADGLDKLANISGGVQESEKDICVFPGRSQKDGECHQLRFWEKIDILFMAPVVENQFSESLAF